MQIALVIFFGKEAWLAVVAALHDMQRNIIEMDARPAGHPQTLAECTLVRN
jgi:hypothetical protein